MRSIIKNSVFLLLLLCCVINNAKAEEILTWNDCVKEAINNHPDLIAADKYISRVRAECGLTTSGLLPQVNGQLSKTESKSSGDDENDTYSYGITGSQVLFDGFKTFYGRASAKRNITAAKFNYKITSAEVRFRLRSAFIEVLNAKELLEITEIINKRRKHNFELVRLRYKAGREHKGSLLTAEANMLQAELEVAQAKRNFSLAQRRLCKELGRKKTTLINIKDDFDLALSIQERPDFEIIAEQTPLLQEMMAQTEAKRFQLKAEKAGFFPKITASASAGKTDSSWPAQNDEWSVGLRLSMPIFEGGSRFSYISQAKAAFAQAQAEQRSSRDEIMLNLEENWVKALDALGDFNAQKKFLEAAEERAKIAQAQYSSELIAFNNWTIIEDDLVRTKKSFLNAKTNAFIAEAAWAQAKGGTLDDEK